jgi:hypothetical protein
MASDLVPGHGANGQVRAPTWCFTSDMAGKPAALASALLASLALTQTGGAAGPWAKLHRPLHLPKVAPGASCPVSRVARVDFEKYGVAKGIGPGPAYPIGFTQPGSRLQFPYPPDPAGEFAGSSWSGTKVLWFVTPRYRGPVLIRGGRLDRPDRLRFDRGKVPPKEMRIPRNASGGWPPGVEDKGQRYRPSYTRLRAPGCYAYQIDGTTFSRVIVFKAELSG